jgi:hypothetical protein
MDRQDFVDLIQPPPEAKNYPSMKFTYMENYFNKHGYDLFVYRPTNSDEALIQVFTQDLPRVLIDSYSLEIRDDLNEQLVEFFERVQSVVEQYKEQEIDIRTRVTVSDDMTIELNDHTINVDSGQIIMVGESSG